MNFHNSSVPVQVWWEHGMEETDGLVTIYADMAVVTYASLVLVLVLVGR
jgi:hypothetical protein